MELILNLGWASVAMWMLCAWVRRAPHKPTDRRLQMVALALVILILLPAISMTDDLAAAQRPAEIDSCLRRPHDQPSCPHCTVSAAAGLPQLGFGGVTLVFAGIAGSGKALSFSIENPALAPIENRPPPMV